MTTEAPMLTAEDVAYWRMLSNSDTDGHDMVANRNTVARFCSTITHLEAQIAVLVEELRAREMGTSFNEDDTPDRRYCGVCEADWPVGEADQHKADCLLVTVPSSATSLLERLAAAEENLGAEKALTECFQTLAGQFKARAEAAEARALPEGMIAKCSECNQQEDLNLANPRLIDRCPVHECPLRTQESKT